MTDWIKDDSGLSVADILAKRPYRRENHAYIQRKRLPKPVCKHCGLLLLRNALTSWCDAHGCNYADHPDYRAAVRRLGGAQ